MMKARLAGPRPRGRRPRGRNLLGLEACICPLEPPALGRQLTALPGPAQEGGEGGGEGGVENRSPGSGPPAAQMPPSPPCKKKGKKGRNPAKLEQPDLWPFTYSLTLVCH